MTQLSPCGQWHRTPTTQETDGFQVKRPGDLSVRCTLLLMLDYQVCASPHPRQQRPWHPHALSLRLGGLRPPRYTSRVSPPSSLPPFSGSTFLRSPNHCISPTPTLVPSCLRSFHALISMGTFSQPPQFKLDPRLARLLGLHTQSRSAIVQALWQYVKTNRLQDSHDKEYINGDKYFQQVP